MAGGRSEIVEQQAGICSDGITKTLALMRESADQVRRHVHAADVQLTTDVEALMFDSILDGKEKHQFDKPDRLSES